MCNSDTMEKKSIKAAAYSGPKDLPAHQKQAVASRQSRGQWNLTIQSSNTKMLQSQEISLATGLEAEFHGADNEEAHLTICPSRNVVPRTSDSRKFQLKDT